VKFMLSRVVELEAYPDKTIRAKRLSYPSL
jgi:hypothetical protein